jgi:glycosyltransferase involved in cell wall biosynthesis
MATYNGAKYISTQLNSILSQLKLEDEIIIIDDCSTDDTVNIINQINDKRIILIHNPQNFGVVYSFNKALTMVNGDIVFLSDQDDEWMNNKVEFILDFFKTEDIDLIVHDAIIVSQEKKIYKSLSAFAKSRAGFFYNVYSNTFTGCCMAFRTSILKKILPIPTYNGVYHDAWIGILSELYRFKVKFIQIPLIQWNRHENNTSTTKRRVLKQIFKDRFNLLYGIFRHLLK